jgi:Mn-dependent DtxR family transcriptional regulator
MSAYTYHPKRFITPEKELQRKKWIYDYYKKDNVPIKKIAEMFLMTPKKVKEIIEEMKRLDL